MFIKFAGQLAQPQKIEAVFKFDSLYDTFTAEGLDFKPIAGASVEIGYKRDILFYGQVLVVKTNLEPAPALNSCGGASLLFRLVGDKFSRNSTITGATLRQYLLEYAGGLIVPRRDEPVAQSVITEIIEERGKAKDEFLIDICKERGLVLSHQLNSLYITSRLYLDAPEARLRIDNATITEDYTQINKNIAVFSAPQSRRGGGQGAGAALVFENPRAILDKTEVVNLTMDNGEMQNAETLMSEAARVQMIGELKNIKLEFESPDFVRPGAITRLQGESWFITDCKGVTDAAGTAFSYTALLSDGAL